MRFAWVLVAAAACLPAPGYGAAAGAGQPVDAGQPAAGLRMNDIQVLGSHNSYKQAMRRWPAFALSIFRRRVAATLDYAHAPLDRQLEAGLRALELDVFHDPGGALFGRDGGQASGFPVLHVQNLDDVSSCMHLVACLQDIERWLRAHAAPVPLVVSLNAKDGAIEWPGAIDPPPFGEAAWLALDAEIRRVFGDRLIEPADVATPHGPEWPLVDDARGRILFVLDEGGAKRMSYANGWAGRAMFGNHPPEHPGAAVMIINDPIGGFDRIQAMVRGGFLVRTRADADTVEARANDTTRRDRAFASGAQIVSTDYYTAATGFGTDYVVTLPGGGEARCNPLRVEATCPL